MSSGGMDLFRAQKSPTQDDGPGGALESLFNSCSGARRTDRAVSCHGSDQPPTHAQERDISL